MFVEEFIAFAVEEHPPIPGRALAGRMLVADRSGTVDGNGVIPTGLLVEIVKRGEILPKSLLGLGRIQGGAINREPEWRTSGGFSSLL